MVNREPDMDPQQLAAGLLTRPEAPGMPAGQGMGGMDMGKIMEMIQQFAQMQGAAGGMPPGQGMPAAPNPAVQRLEQAAGRPVQRHPDAFPVKIPRTGTIGVRG